MHILVTGGAGYIGSVMTDVLVDAAHDVTVFDNLSRGHRDAVSSRATFVEGDLLDTSRVLRTLQEKRIDAVIHMAGDALVAESTCSRSMYCSAASRVWRSTTSGAAEMATPTARWSGVSSR